MTTSPRMWTPRSPQSLKIPTSVKKKGDLAQLWVYRFRSQGQLYLLGYTRDDEVRLIWLEAMGPHENFYRDIKR